MSYIIKNHKRAEFHPVLRRYIFGKIIGWGEGVGRGWEIDLPTFLGSKHLPRNELEKDYFAHDAAYSHSKNLANYLRRNF